MGALPVLDTLETERLLLRPRRVTEAGVYRQLWTERDPRVPAHRRIDVHGRPTVSDVAAQLRAEDDAAGWRLLAVQRKDTAEVIGYCGLIPRTNGSPEEPELAYELLRAFHGRGYATEAAAAVVGWAGDAGCPRLWATVWDWNTASRRVLEKLRFREIGRAELDPLHGRNLLAVRELRAPG
jgi:RimJ/RimL family protein N-acetyltransferase